MRIAVIDENPVRAAIIEDGLAEVGERDVFVISERSGMARAIESIDPDVILIDLGNPSRDMLEEYFAVSRAVSRPIAMFVEQSDDDTIGAAIDAGVSAYIVDGFGHKALPSIFTVADRTEGSARRVVRANNYRQGQENPDQEAEHKRTGSPQTAARSRHEQQ